MPKKTHNFSQSDYYKKRKDELSQIRKNKYLTDPVFQEAAKQRAKEAYRRRKGDSDTEKLSPETFRVGSITYNTVGYIARNCNITANLINYYHDQGYIPIPQDVAGYSRRMYNMELAEAIIVVITAYTKRELQKPAEMYDKLVALLGKQKIKEMTVG